MISLLMVLNLLQYLCKAQLSHILTHIIISQSAYVFLSWFMDAVKLNIHPRQIKELKMILRSST